MFNVTSYQGKRTQNQAEDDFMLTRMTNIKNKKQILKRPLRVGDPPAIPGRAVK